jgi:hypothetical protein
MSLTWFITAASRGIRRKLTEQALARGASVAATLHDSSQPCPPVLATDAYCSSVEMPRIRRRCSAFAWAPQRS